jgi:hypothetical protein
VITEGGEPLALLRDACQEDSWARLQRRFLSGARLVTLGPKGTSSHEAAEFLMTCGVPGFSEANLQMRSTFQEILDVVTSDPSQVALVPSACREATLFHWHSRLRLLFHFVRSTPDYGIAAQPGRLPDGDLRLATMAEVSSLYAELDPPGLQERRVHLVDARSTHHAARLVTAGRADLAITNESSKTDAGLAWVARRQGAAIVWLLFGQVTALPHEPHTPPHKE